MMLTQYVIYENPADYPNKFVLRIWTINGGKTIADASVILTDTLEEARSHIPQGLFNLGRYEQDDPVIREVWM